ncbi:MAG: oxidoreductase [Rhodobacteraceae bacterium]|jgi:3-hydroxyisobutyrate dehydrogenase-like beta-hydroxyacid dehydrogenase|nr:oxidoreductase [Paracoccaceae bacterium]|tara:strand:+ start:104 stop:970 length:867 start_codon:yes stop_codon:yes gene_type:complete
MKKITFIGLGVMGFPMAGHLSKQGYGVSVYNRSKEKSKLWTEKYNGKYFTSVKEAVTNSDIVFSCVGNDTDLRDITLGEDKAFSAMKPDSVFVDHTTTSSDIASELYKKAKEYEIHFLDAPVSGGEVGAVKGELTVMIGGEKPIFDRVNSAITAYAKNITLVGGPGKGQVAKMINQICIAGLIQALSEAISFSEKSGMDTKKVLQAISQGAAGSWQLSNRGETMVDRKFDFGFAVKLMRKDLGICLDHASKNDISLPVTSIVNQFYAEIQRNGGSNFDTSSLLTRFDN